MKRKFKDISIPEYIYEKCPPGYGFNAAEIAEIYEDSNTQDNKIDIADDLTINFYYNGNSNSGRLIAIVDKPKKMVTFAVRVFSDLCGTPLDDLSPLEMIRNLTTRFGLDVTVAGKTAKLFFKEKLKKPDRFNPTPLCEVSNPENLKFVSVTFVKPEKSSIRVALVFFLDITEYGKWIESH